MDAGVGAAVRVVVVAQAPIRCPFRRWSAGVADVEIVVDENEAAANVAGTVGWNSMSSKQLAAGSSDWRSNCMSRLRHRAKLRGGAADLADVQRGIAQVKRVNTLSSQAAVPPTRILPKASDGASETSTLRTNCDRVLDVKVADSIHRYAIGL